MGLPKLEARSIVIIATLALASTVVGQCPVGGYIGGASTGGSSGGGATTGGLGGPVGTSGGAAEPGPTGPATPRPAVPQPSPPSSQPTTGGHAVPPPAPAPSGPTTGGPRGSGAAPAARAAGTTPGARGVPIGEDTTTWQHWWDFNQEGHLPGVAGSTAPATGSDDFYLGSMRRVSNGAPAPERTLVVDRVLPALQRAVEVGPRDVTAAAMLSLARIAADHRDFAAFDVLAPRLQAGDQTVRETAAIALGLVHEADPRPLDLLLAIVRDDAAGQQAVGSAVDDRTRSFAAFGLGLMAKNNDAVATKRRVFEALRDVLADRDLPGRDLRVAAVHAIGLLDIDQHTYAGAKLAQEALLCLDEYFSADLGLGEQSAQAHAPTAIARLLHADESRVERYRERFAAILDGKDIDTGKGKSGRVAHEIAQSCALALGQLCRANDGGNEGENPDVRHSRLLLDAWKNHKDAQTRNFAVLALGQIGGQENRKLLLREFHKASANIEQPWCALALGLFAAEHHARTGKPDALIGATLTDEFKSSKNPEAAAALAVAIGLARSEPANDLLRRRLLDSGAREELAAALCQSLSLLGDASAPPALRATLQASDRRPEVLEQAATALGRLGDREIGSLLVTRMVAGEPNHAMQAALATALVDIGAQAQIEPLLQVLDDTGRSASARAGAARALGGIVASREQQRWNTPLRQNANYRANTATLTDRFAGVLDLR